MPKLEYKLSRRSIAFVVGILIIGAMLGSLVGELIRFMLADGVVKEVFLRSIDISLGPMILDLIMFSLTIGFTLKLNFIGLIGLAVAYYILRYWR
jgi:putative exporter of polyketide antibiotics